VGSSCTALLVALAAAPVACGGSVTAEVPPSRSPAAVEVPLAKRQPIERAEGERGYASWYGKALAGRRTASGERFDPSKMTAAHRTLPLGTWVEVRRPDVGTSVRVRITDRGPFGDNSRIIDLSRAAAEKLGIVKAGLALVELRVVERP
jgi:rare lipoprotein A